MCVQCGNVYIAYIAYIYVHITAYNVHIYSLWMQKENCRIVMELNVYYVRGNRRPISHILRDGMFHTLYTNVLT